MQKHVKHPRKRNQNHLFTLYMHIYRESYHVGVYLAEGRCAKDVLKQLLLGIDPHPKENVLSVL